MTNVERKWRKLRRMLTTSIEGSLADWRDRMEAQVAVVDEAITAARAADRQQVSEGEGRKCISCSEPW